PYHGGWEPDDKPNSGGPGESAPGYPSTDDGWTPVPETTTGTEQGSGGSQADQTGPKTEPEPWGDVPPAPGDENWRSWRELPGQQLEYSDGNRLRLDGNGHAEFDSGGRTYRHEGSGWVDAQTGETAPRAVGGKAYAAIWDAEHGMPPR
nr:hypothetical protein [Chloroflexota bacterium]